jgi:pilus assembly protein FimV
MAQVGQTAQVAQVGRTAQVGKTALVAQVGPMTGVTGGGAAGAVDAESKSAKCAAQMQATMAGSGAGVASGFQAELERVAAVSHELGAKLEMTLKVSVKDAAVPESTGKTARMVSGSGPAKGGAKLKDTQSDGGQAAPADGSLDAAKEAAPVIGDVAPVAMQSVSAPVQSVNEKAAEKTVGDGKRTADVPGVGAAAQGAATNAAAGAAAQEQRPSGVEAAVKAAEAVAPQMVGVQQSVTTTTASVASAALTLGAAGGAHRVAEHGAAGNVAGMNPFQRMDAAPSAAAATVLVGTARRIEVGVGDAGHGWLRIAATNDGGSVAAGLVPSSAAGEQGLKAEMAGMQRYLDEQRIPVSALTVHAAQETAGMDAGAQQGGRSAEDPQSANGRAGKTAAWRASGESEAGAGGVVPQMAWPMADGHWLSVMA